MQSALPRNVFIFGASGQAKVAADILRLSGYHILGFIDKESGKENKLFGIPILGDDGGPRTTHLLRGGVDYFVAIGNNDIRERVTERVQNSVGKAPVNAIHPDAVVSQFAKMGEGNFINCGVKINTGAVIGNHTIINTSATVDHDCTLDDYVQLGPGVHLAGVVSVGRSAYLWTGAMLIPKIKIGPGSIIGAGAVVTDNIPARVTAVGAPAKIIKRH